MHQCLSWEILHFILGKSFDFFIVFIFQTFFTMLHGLWDLSSPTRD